MNQLSERTPKAAPIPKVPVYLLHGDEELRKRRAVSKIITSLGGEQGQNLDIDRFEAAEAPVEDVLETLACPPLFSDVRVVVVTDVQAYAANAQDRLAHALESTPHSLHAILVASAPQGRSRSGPQVSAKLREVVENRGKIYEFTTPRGGDAIQWVQREVARAGKTISRSDAETMVLAAGTDLAIIANEIQKLAAYLGERERITREDIDAVVIKSEQYSIFNLVDAIGERRVERALSVLPSVLSASGDGGGALRVIAMVARQFRLLWQARVLADNGVDLRKPADAPADLAALLPESPNVLSEVKRHRFLAMRYMKQARNFSTKQLSEAIERIFEADCAAKGLTDETSDERAVLENMIADLCTTSGAETER